MKFTLVLDPDRPLGVPHPTKKEITQAVLENNDFVKLVYEFSSRTAPTGILVECDNKPRDMPTYGVTWKEIK